MSKPRVLVLGGVGFIGRNLVVHLVENDLCEKIRIVDKVLPATAYLTEKQKAAFAKAEFKQGNLVNPASISAVFDDEKPFDYVINCAAETKYSQTEEVYQERVFQLSVNCATEAAKRKVKKFIELSTAQIYDSDKKPSSETDKIKPWTQVSKFKLNAEQELLKLNDANVVILRPATVYGPSDVSGLTPRLIIGAVYKQLGEPMKLLWKGELRVNTVHVRDVVKAIWLMCETGKHGDIYNLADQGDSSQESINVIVKEIFGVNYGYQTMVVNNYAKLFPGEVTENVNDKHLQPWSDLCKKENITNTPLTPFLDPEVLANNSLTIDGSKIKSVGFTYDYPKPTKELCMEVINDFISVNAFPKAIL